MLPSLLILIGLTIPLHIALIPLFINLRSLGLLNTRLALIGPYTGFGLAFGTYVMKGFFEELPQDLRMNSNGLAIVVNDDLANSYQQLNPQVHAKPPSPERTERADFPHHALQDGCGRYARVGTATRAMRGDDVHPVAVARVEGERTDASGM